MNAMKIAAFALALALAATMGSPGFAASYGARAVKSFAQAENEDLVVPARSARRGNFGRGHRSGRNFARGHRSGRNFARGHRSGRNFRRGHRFRHGGGHSSFLFAFVFPFHYFSPYYPYYPYYPSYGYGSYSYYGQHSSHQSRQQRCRPVTGIGRDRDGRKAKFGGTMCYDRYGSSYIVPGSRHVIHYYN